MSTLEIAEKAVADLAPEEFESFLRWLSSQIGERLGGTREKGRPNAEELAQRFDCRVREGSTQPFEGADLSNWPEPARLKAEAMIARWRAEHGK